MRLTLSPSLYLSIPPSGSISEWFSSRNTLLRRQLKKSERSKQFSLMPSPLCPPVRSSALRLRRLPLPSSHRSQPTSRELRASSPCNQASRRLLRRGCGGGGQDPEIRSGRCLPRSPGSAARPPGAGFRAPVAVFLSGLGLGCAARSRLRQRRLPVLRRREEERWRRIVVASAHLASLGAESTTGYRFPLLKSQAKGRVQTANARQKVSPATQ